MKSVNRLAPSTLVALISVGSLTSCESSYNFTDLNPDVTNHSSANSSSDPSCYSDQFQQPAEQISHSVDILFVADTSGSMSPKRAKVADALYAFVGALPAGTDYRIGVVLAHSSTDPDSGNLYSSTSAIPKVLDSSTMTQATIQNDLKWIMLGAPDVAWEEGEMGSYALLQALSPAKLAASRALGFFRQNTALAIVTISDENDICAVYPTSLPANYTLNSSPYSSMPGMTLSEYNIRHRDCPNGITTDQVINAVKGVQGDRPYVINAVIHTDINYYDQSAPGDSYGWGYAEVINQSHGVLVDIGDASLTSGLAQIGALTTTKITLRSDFTLSHQNVNPNSIQVHVDRNLAQFDYSASRNEVHLSSDLGHPLSKIDIGYCLNAGNPTP